MSCGQRFGEKVFGRLSISCRTYEEVQRIVSRIHRPIQVHPHLFHFHICFVNTPGISVAFRWGRQRFSSSGAYRNFASPKVSMTISASATMNRSKPRNIREAIEHKLQNDMYAGHVSVSRVL